MKKILIILVLASIAVTSSAKKITISREVLADKIKGGWAGQTFGCAFGGPTEFKWKDQIIPDNVNIKWDKSRAKYYFINVPGLYDDIYMDVTFLKVMDEFGLNATASQHAHAFANAGYPLWHANQAARYNILHGIEPPASGHWKNNPHADDIDFQIEADFAGLIAPCMPEYALGVCDTVGHIMCYGDGYYGGVYVATMYTLAFYYDDINAVVKDALKAIPSNTVFYEIIDDTIRWCGQNLDWKATWQLVQDKYGKEIGCPEGVQNPLNIDAKINAAYIVMGLLYGNGDWNKTIDISTRCGQDSDCNPANAAGILGTMVGYSNIPEYWTCAIEEAKGLEFAHTGLDIDATCALNEKLALQVIKENGGKVNDKNVKIKVQDIVTAPYEQCWEGLDLVGKFAVNCKDFSKPLVKNFNGSAVVMNGAVKADKGCPQDYVAEFDVTIDGVTEVAYMPVDKKTRKNEVYYNYDLQNGNHKMEISWRNPRADVNVHMWSMVVYKTK